MKDGTPEYRAYRTPDPEEGFLQVREWEDRRLMEEYRFLSGLYHAVCSEVAFRADNPEYRDGTGEIRASNVDAYQTADTVAAVAGLELDHYPDKRIEE